MEKGDPDKTALSYKLYQITHREANCFRFVCDIRNEGQELLTDPTAADMIAQGHVQSKTVKGGHHSPAFPL